MKATPSENRLQAATLADTPAAAVIYGFFETRDANRENCSLLKPQARGWRHLRQLRESFFCRIACLRIVWLLVTFACLQAEAANHPPTLPGAPTVTSGTVTASGATIHWGASTDADGNTITYELQYTIYNTPSDPWHSAGTTTSLSRSISGLAAGTTYNVRVQASDGLGGLSSWSLTTQAFTTLQGNRPPTTPGAPTVPSGTVTASGATASWGASTDPDGNTITYELQYTIYNTPSDPWHSAGTTTSLSRSISGLAAGTTFNVRVQASDGLGGLSSWSLTAPAFTTLQTGGTVRVTVNSSSGSTLSTSEMNAVILFDSTGSEVARKQPPTSNPMDFASVNYGGYSVDVYCWDMLAAGISFPHNSSLTTITLPANPKRPLTVTAFYNDGSTRLPGATVYLDSWNGQFSNWTQRASAATDSSGMVSFSAWPTTKTGEQYRIRVNNGGSQVGLRDPASVANTSGGSSYSINTSVAPPIQYGKISARLKNVAGTDAPVSAGTPRFKLYTSPNQILSGANPATFSNIPVGNYLLEGYQTGTFWGEEFWNSEQFTVAAGATLSAVLTRKYPYATSVVMKDVETGATITAGQTIAAGTQVRFEVTVRNDVPNTPLSTQVHFVLDLSQGASFDYNWPLSAAQVIAGSGGTKLYAFTTAINGFQTGQFYYALQVMTDTGTSVVPTDSWTWTQACGTDRTNKLSGFVAPLQPDAQTYGWTSTHAFMQLYPIGTTAGVNPNLRTWIIIHGRNGSSKNQWVVDLARAIAAVYPTNQILLLDWTEAADGGLVGTTEEDWIKPVAAWAAGKLVDYGFSGSDLNLIGYSWGGNMTDELAERIAGGVNTIVALDPAHDGEGRYNPEGPGEIDFRGNSQFSWAFHSSLLGSSVTPTNADETFIVETGLSLVIGSPEDAIAHSAVHDLFTYMITNSSGGVSSNFQLSRLLAHQSGPWMPNLFTTSFDQGWPYIEMPTIGYEGIIYAAAGGLTPAALLYTNSSVQRILVYETTDTIAPTVTINQASGQSDPTNSFPINFTVVFSEPVTGFASGDVTLGGTAGATSKTVTGNGTTYNVAVSGMTQSGTVTATIPAGVAQDGAGNPSLASTSSDNTVNYIATDTTPPTVTINQAAGQSDPTGNSPINFTVIFSEAVTGFASSDVTLVGTAGATGKSVTGSGTTYNVAVSGMTQNGTVTVSIPAGAAQDGAGNSSLASTSSDNSVVYNVPDTTPPSVTINQAAGQSDPTGNSSINFTVIFSETVTGFSSGDVTLGGTAGATSKDVTGSGTTYNVAVSGMTQSGTVTATIPAGAAQDGAGNPSLDSTSGDNSVTYNALTRVISLSVNLVFGDVIVGSSAQSMLTVSNTGNSTLTVSSITYPSGFSGSWSGTIAAGNSQQVTVTFLPASATSYSGTATVNSDKTSGVNTLAVSGAGTTTPTRVISLSGNLAFGNVTVGSSAQSTLTIGNTGNSPLTVTGITYPSGFNGSWSSGTIAAGSSQPVTVTFAPTSANSYNGNLTVSSDATGGSGSLALSGTGTLTTRSEAFADLAGGFQRHRDFFVTLRVRPGSGVQAYSAEETVPPGWIVKAGSLDQGGAYDVINRKAKWGPYFDNLERVLSFTLEPGANTDTVVFAGVASFDGVDVPFTGRRVIVRKPFMREDVNAAHNVKTDGFRVVVQGEAGKRYDIEATETPWLANSWVAVATNLDGAALVDFTDTLATSRSRRFYRVIER